MYQKIESEYNHYISSKVKDIGITEFKKKLAKMIGTTTSNIYEIIKDGLVTVRDYEYRERIEFSAIVAYNKRTKKSIESNASKRLSARDFINLVIKEFRSDYNINSIDEIINDLKLNRVNEIEGMETICTSTFYNYVKVGKIEGFSKKELPMTRKDKNKKKKLKLILKEPALMKDHLNLKTEMNLVIGKVILLLVVELFQIVVQSLL